MTYTKTGSPIIYIVELPAMKDDGPSGPWYENAFSRSRHAVHAVKMAHDLAQAASIEFFLEQLKGSQTILKVLQAHHKPL